jgi:hypothetical protein
MAIELTSVESMVTLSSKEEDRKDLIEVGQYGLPLKALLSNFSCIFGLQSGVAALNPSTTIRGCLQKRLQVSVNWHRLPYQVRRYFMEEGSVEGGKDNLLAWIEEQVADFSTEDKVFTYGDTILSLSIPITREDGTSYTFTWDVLKHTLMNQPIIPRQVGGVKRKKVEEEVEVEAGEITMDILKVQVICDLDVTSQWWKFRGDGIKATTCPVELKFYEGWHPMNVEVSVDYDVMFGIESLKGGLAYLIAYCNSNGGGTIHQDDGYLLMNNGEKVDLLASDSSAHKWIKDNTHELWVEFPMINAEFRSVLLKRDAKSIALDESEVTDATDLFLVSIEEDHVILRERIHVLAAAM